MRIQKDSASFWSASAARRHLPSSACAPDVSSNCRSPCGAVRRFTRLGCLSNTWRPGKGTEVLSAGFAVSTQAREVQEVPLEQGIYGARAGDVSSVTLLPFWAVLLCPFDSPVASHGGSKRGSPMTRAHPEITHHLEWLLTQHRLSASGDIVGRSQVVPTRSGPRRFRRGPAAPRPRIA